MISVYFSEPHGGKSAIYSIIAQICDTISECFDTNILVEYYSRVGLQKHQVNNNGYALVCSDEGHSIFIVLNLKQQKN